MVFGCFWTFLFGLEPVDVGTYHLEKRMVGSMAHDANREADRMEHRYFL